MGKRELGGYHSQWDYHSIVYVYLVQYPGNCLLRSINGYLDRCIVLFTLSLVKSRRLRGEMRRVILAFVARGGGYEYGKFPNRTPSKPKW